MKGWFFLLLSLSLPAVGEVNQIVAQSERKGSLTAALSDKERALERMVLLIQESLIDEVGDDLAGNFNQIQERSMVLEYFEELINNPIEINRANRSDFERLLVLTRFQIESIIDYRIRCGDIISAAELSLVHGFNEEIVDVLYPFLSFASAGEYGAKDSIFTFKEFLRDCKSQLYFKSTRDLHHNEMFDPISKEDFEKNPNSRYIGTPYYLLLKYKCSYKSRISAGVTLENDIGEPLFSPKAPAVDFFSFNMALHNIGAVNTIVIGDYSVRWGQGLTLWNSFNLGGSTTPSLLFKKGSEVVPYTSAQESNFYRGAAASLSFGNLDLNAIISYNGVDARIKEGKYTSILNDGLHNTYSLLATRNSMNEVVGGVSVTYLLKRVRLGLRTLCYSYDTPNGRDVKEYNRYQMYDGLWGNSSVDFYAVFKNVRMFGELALDMGGSAALLCGSIFPLGQRLECGLLGRIYSKSYIAPHAGAYSTLSTVANQRGVTLNSLYSISRGMKLAFNSEFNYYPWLRYNVGTPSYMFKSGVKLQIEKEHFNGYINLSHTCYSYDNPNKIYIKSKFSYNFSSILRGTLHSAYVYAGSSGYEGGTDWRYKSRNGRFKINAGLALFSCNEWKSRLYLYEYDLPYTYNSRLLYGRGISFYMVMDYLIAKGVGLYIKNGTQCYFNKNKESQSELKFALKIKF